MCTIILLAETCVFYLVFVTYTKPKDDNKTLKIKVEYFVLETVFSSGWHEVHLNIDVSRGSLFRKASVDKMIKTQIFCKDLFVLIVFSSSRGRFLEDC